MERTWIALVLLGALTISSLAQVQIDLATTYSGRNIFAESVREYADRVVEATDGEVRIVVHEGGSLGLKDEDPFSAASGSSPPPPPPSAGSPWTSSRPSATATSSPSAPSPAPARWAC